MRNSHKRWLGAIVAVCAATALVVATAASAGLILKESFHDDGTSPIADLCGVSGLTVNDAFTLDGHVHAVPHGPSGFAYFIEHDSLTQVLTNPATGKAVTIVGNSVTKDQKVTDNGDGTLTILVMGVGNEVMYGPDGKAIYRNPGQTRSLILVDANGTPTDPFDDVFLADLGVVKGSTGRTDDFCLAVVPALS